MNNNSQLYSYMEMTSMGSNEPNMSHVIPTTRGGLKGRYIKRVGPKQVLSSKRAGDTLRLSANQIRGKTLPMPSSSRYAHMKR